MKGRSIAYLVPSMVIALSMGACNGTGDAGTKQSAENTGSTAVVSRDSVLTQQNAELRAQKDSLFVAARSLFDAISAIDSAAAKAGYKAKAGKGEHIAAYEEQVRDRTVRALQRLKVAESRLNTSIATVKSLSTDNAQLKADVEQFRETATALQLQITSQQARADTLMQRLTDMEGKNKQLATSVDSLVTVSHKVYVVAGSKDFLLEHNLISEVGGTRFPLIVKRGATIRPSNIRPDTTLFKRYDMLNDRVIPLDSSKEYEVVSAQDLAATDRSQTENRGRVYKGSIRILDPQKFWQASPYLILREE